MSNEPRAHGQNADTGSPSATHNAASVATNPALVAAAFRTRAGRASATTAATPMPNTPTLNFTRSWVPASAPNAAGTHGGTRTASRRASTTRSAHSTDASAAISGTGRTAAATIAIRATAATAAVAGSQRRRAR